MSIELQKGLVLHQRLDQESLKSTVIFGDKTPYENDGTSAVDPPVFAADHMSVANRAMVFNGSSDFISIDNDPSIDITGRVPFTLSVWMKLDNLVDMWKNSLISYSTGTPLSQKCLELKTGSSGNKVEVIFSDGTNQSHFYSADNLITASNYHHIVLISDTITAKIYIDGIQSGSSHTILYDLNSTYDVEIGRGYCSPSYLLNGNIDEVRIYNRAISQEEITALSETYRPILSIGSLYKDIVLDMPLDLVHTKGGAAGSETMTDLTPYSNDGTNNGATVEADYSTFVAASSDYIRIPDSESLSPTSKMSAFAWVNGDSGFVISHYDHGLNERSFFTNTVGDKLRAFISDDGTQNVGHYKMYDSSITAFDNTWHLVGFIFNAVVLKLYVDGVEDTNPTKVTDYAITTIHDSTVDVTIGCYLSNNVTQTHFDGDISKPKVWNRELSADEVLLMFETEKGLFL